MVGFIKHERGNHGKWRCDTWNNPGKRKKRSSRSKSSVQTTAPCLPLKVCARNNFPISYLCTLGFGSWRVFSYSSILEPPSGGMVAAPISLIQSHFYKSYWFSFKCKSLDTFPSALLMQLKYDLQANRWVVLWIKRCWPVPKKPQLGRGVKSPED